MKLLIAFAFLSVLAAAQGAAITTYPLVPTSADDVSQLYNNVPFEVTPQIRTGGGLLGGLPLLGGSNFLGGSSLLGSSALPWGGGAVYGGGLLNNNFLPIQLSIPNLLSSLLVNI